jgi:hypothetical protein
MTDRELTEAAARAVGIKIEWWHEGTSMERAVRVDDEETFGPLEEDGDAFRLMVALNMRVEPARTMHGSYDRVSVTVTGRGHIGSTIMYGSDPRAAWRRAIVETAAALVADITGENSDA